AGADGRAADAGAHASSRAVAWIVAWAMGRRPRRRPCWWPPRRSPRAARGRVVVDGGRDSQRAVPDQSLIGRGRRAVARRFDRTNGTNRICLSTEQQILFVPFVLSEQREE